MAIVLIDTSSWTHALRPTGDPAVRSRVQSLLLHNQAAWCDPVRLELWNGVRGDSERKKLKAFERLLPLLPVNAAIWSDACGWAERARVGGLTVPAIDLIIFACAKHHAVGLEHNDRHYILLEQLK